MTAVNNVDITVEAGRTVAVVGESGAGKSTVGRLALRLEEPDPGGVVRFEGVGLATLDRRELRAVRPRMQMIFQDPYSSFDPRRRMDAAVAQPLVVHTDLDAAARAERVRSLFAQVGLGEEHLRRLPRDLSGGQLQRIAVARCLATDPVLIVCDEAVSSLDVSTRALIVNLLKDVQASRNLAYLFISHDIALVRLIADRIVVMRHGEVVEQGTAAAVVEDPQHEYTKELVAAVPMLRRRAG
jgi:oligopeptide transport system ATP-binding protein